jgi:hypothetical protein
VCERSSLVVESRGRGRCRRWCSSKIGLVVVTGDDESDELMMPVLPEVWKGKKTPSEKWIFRKSRSSFEVHE